MRLHNHSLSKVSLSDVLRKRRTNLKKFLDDSGIVTYELLAARCASMGVLVPAEDEFNLAKGIDSSMTPEVSSPTEGVLVLNSPPIILESTGKSVYTEEREAPQIEVQVITQLSDQLFQNSNEFKRNKNKR
jgi:hypothetical protein